MDLNQKEDNEKTLSMQKIYPIQTKTLQNDVKSTYTRQSSLKNFNTLPHKIIPIIEANESLGGRDEEPPISSPEYRDKTIAIKINENGINSPKSSQLMGFTQEQILSTERSLNQHYLSNKMQTDKLTKFMMFYKNYHKILALYYRYDQRNSRPVRVTLLYLSILGQMSVVNWFGEVFDFQIVLILSLITYTFDLLFKRILQLERSYFYSLFSHEQFCYFLIYGQFNRHIICYILYICDHQYYSFISKYFSLQLMGLWLYFRFNYRYHCLYYHSNITYVHDFTTVGKKECILGIIAKMQYF